MLQDYRFLPVRTAAILTGSYVAGTVIGTQAVQPALENQLIVCLDFTIGSLTSCEVKVEFSDDDSDYYQETFSNISSGTDSLSLGIHQMTATGKYTIAIPAKYRFIKVSAKGTGTTTNSSLAINAIIGTV